jgi:hypothetical protein
MRETCLVHITKTHTQREKKKILERERGDYQPQILKW